MALGYQCLVGRHNNQLKVDVGGGGCIGEGARPGWNVWEDVVALFWAANGTTKKLKIKYIVALDCRHQINHTQQSTKNMQAQRRRDRRGGLTGMEHGGGAI